MSLNNFPCFSFVLCCFFFSFASTINLYHFMVFMSLPDFHDFHVLASEVATNFPIYFSSLFFVVFFFISFSSFVYILNMTKWAKGIFDICTTVLQLCSNNESIFPYAPIFGAKIGYVQQNHRMGKMWKYFNTSVSICIVYWHHYIWTLKHRIEHDFIFIWLPNMFYVSIHLVILCSFEFSHSYLNAEATKHQTLNGKNGKCCVNKWGWSPWFDLCFCVSSVARFISQCGMWLQYLFTLFFLSFFLILLTLKTCNRKAQ